MSTQNPRSSCSSSTTSSSLGKRQAPSSLFSSSLGENPLSNISVKNPFKNISFKNPLNNTSFKTVTDISLSVPSSSTSSSLGKNPLSNISVKNPFKNISFKNPLSNTSFKTVTDISLSVPSSTLVPSVPRKNEVEPIDNNDPPAVDSINRKTLSNLYISDHEERTGNVCNRDVLAEMETDDKIVNVDNNYIDFYQYLRAYEAKKRPSTDYMDKIQKDINASMRSKLIDWLVGVAEYFKLEPGTLYLTINYIDRYLSGNLMNKQRIQLLGVACMMIAFKYEEICAPWVEKFCDATDNRYSREEVLQMESAVLNYLKFEMTAPTAKCFLRRFVCVAQATSEVPSMDLECLANYLGELSLLEYGMLRYAPSLNSTLRHYTLYQVSDLSDCIKALHSLCRNGSNSNLPAIRENYSQHKYEFVAKKYSPSSIPLEFFQEPSG